MPLIAAPMREKRTSIYHVSFISMLLYARLNDIVYWGYVILKSIPLWSNWVPVAAKDINFNLWWLALCIHFNYYFSHFKSLDGSTLTLLLHWSWSDLRVSLFMFHLMWIAVFLISVHSSCMLLSILLPFISYYEASLAHYGKISCWQALESWR